MDLKDIEYRKETDLAWITLARPETRNAFTTDMLDSVAWTLEDAKADDAVKVILLAAQGESFCSGGNVKDMVHGQLVGWEMKNYLWNHVHRFLLTLEDIDKPVIAAINGAAAGGGLDIALACDMRIASERATFCASYVHLGLAPGGGGAFNLPRIIGMPKALELMLSGRTIDASEALSLGMVNHVTPHDELQGKARDLARSFSQWSLPALRMIKRAAYNGAVSSFRAHLDYISSQLALLSQTPEHRQALDRLPSKLK